MLKDNLFKYYFFRVKFFFSKPKFTRDPLKKDFKMTFNDKTIHGRIDSLIRFAQNNCKEELIDVKFIYGCVDWECLYKNLSKKSIREHEKIHMSIIIDVSLSYPIIVAKNKNESVYKVIDGLHRVKKAYLLRLKFIKAYIIPETILLTYK
ncbi:MAG: ParB N-terminal domain-containing protein [Ferruginibacter sp.]|nr:ParB N-terminal domain-containing protein [Ferruginibacter sp.]